ncbi:TMV resistance protein N-like isoform X2 [Daucus carota subsp. sativus]
MGDNISDALREAIEESKIYIVVFSKNYASSPWCLNELVDIVRFKNTEHRLIIPVFYKIDPSVVRHVTESFKKAFEVHQEGYYKDQMQQVDKWRAALKEAANVSGEHVCEKNRVEADVIERIVADILPRINPKVFDEETVGLDYSIESIEAMLSNQEGVTKIGIYGMGGVGKTTLAKAVFTKIYLLFEGSCFLANITSDSGTVNDMKALQQQLLSDVLLQNEKDVNNVAQGENLIKARLRKKKILVVIDDLNHTYQYKSLGVESFAQGSVVIVTTRHEDILEDFGVITECRYRVNKLGPRESLILFKQHAFQFGSKPDSALVKLSNDILYLADGLPLALKVFGSFLRTKYTIEEWRDFIEKLKDTPNKEIQDSLLISFNAIDDDPQVKKMFLDIACFFVGWSKERVFKILGTYYSNVNVKINNLKKRCLLAVHYEDMVDKDVLHMHDLLRDMGREVARNNSPGEPEKYSRLWLSEDIHTVLSEDNEEIMAIEGILYNEKGVSSCEITLETETFKKMKKLRFLRLSGFKDLTGSFKQAFKDLRWLHWDLCPLHCLPPEFKPLNLEILVLRRNIMRTLVPGMVFKKLHTLDISYSIYLTRTPDFNMLPCLVTLNIEECKRLEEVDRSVGSLPRLVSLNLRGCVKLASLPDTIGHLKALKHFNASNCPSLVEVPEELGNMESLEELKIMGLNGEKLPQSIGLLYNLVVLDSAFNRKLKTLPENICKLRSLEVLKVDLCYNLEALPEELGNITSLKVLDISGTRVSSLPDSIGYLTNLVKLILSNNSNLNTLPDTICNLRSLKILEIDSCERLEELPGQLQKITSLRELLLSSTAISKVELSQLPLSLKRLDFSKSVLTALPSGISQLSNLEYLNIEGCKQLLSIEELPPNLKELNASYCPSVKIYRAILKHLEVLNLEYCSGLKEIQGLEELTSVKEFNFTWCRQLWCIAELPPNLKLLSAYQCSSLKRLPHLSNLKHMEKMDLRKCVGLTEIQGLEELTSLKILDLDMCTNLLTIGELPSTIEWMKANGCSSMKILPDLSNLKHLEMLDLTGCSALTEIQGSEELSSIRELRLEDCSLSLLQRIFTKRFFQTYSGFGNVIRIYPGVKMYLPSWISQLHDSESRRRVSLDLTPSTSHNFLGTILCFKEATSVHWNENTYSIKNIRSGFKWSSSIHNYYTDGLIIIVPESIFSVTDSDHRIEFTAAGREFFAIHLLYSD